MDYTQSAVKNIMTYFAGPLAATLILGGTLCKNGLEQILSNPFERQAICIQNNDYAPPEITIPIKQKSAYNITTPEKPNYAPEIKVQEGKKEEKISQSRIEEHKKDFLKDSETILLARMLYGEARGDSFAEKIAIAFTPINRAKDGLKYNGEELKESILWPWQYSCFNKNNSNLPKLKNPEKDEPKEWKKCLELSSKILNGKYNQYNFGQTHYHVKGLKPLPKWVKSMKEKIDSTGFSHQFYRGV